MWRYAMAIIHFAQNKCTDSDGNFCCTRTPTHISPSKQCCWGSLCVMSKPVMNRWDLASPTASLFLSPKSLWWNDLLCVEFFCSANVAHTTVHFILYHCSMPQRITIAFWMVIFFLLVCSLSFFSFSLLLAASTCSQYTVAAGSKLESEKLHHRNLSWNVLLHAACTSEMAKACDNQQEIILLSFYYLHRMLRWLSKDEVVVDAHRHCLFHSLHLFFFGWLETPRNGAMTTEHTTTESLSISFVLPVGIVYNILGGRRRNQKRKIDTEIERFVFFYLLKYHWVRFSLILFFSRVIYLHEAKM